MNKYRSKLEGIVAKKLPQAKYEPFNLDYWQKKTYTPDFVIGRNLIEVKGFFRPGDQAKYKAINEQCQENGDTFIFLFSHPNKPVRRGAKLTMSGWAEKNNIPWFGLDDVKRLKEFTQ